MPELDRTCGNLDEKSLTEKIKKRERNLYRMMTETTNNMDT